MLTLLAVTLTPACANAKPVRCAWTTKQECSGGACVADIPTIRSTIDLETGAYRRCDTKGCDNSKGVVSKSGAFYVIDLPGRGGFAKIGEDGSATEVMSLGELVLIYQGKCL